MPTPKKTSKAQPLAPPNPSNIVGSQKAYDDFLPAAQSLPNADVRPFRSDASLAYHNVQLGVDAITPLIDQIKKDLPAANIPGLLALPNLALAVIYAAAQVDRSSDGSTQALLEKAHVLRDVLLKSAEALAASNLIPQRDVDKIREGRGSIDIAQDNVDLAALLTKHAIAIKGKTAVSAAQIKEAATVGTDLLKRLKPKGAKSKDPAIDAVNTRDRLWTLLIQGHRELRRVGLWIWMDEIDHHVPALQSRSVGSTKKKVTAPIAPTGSP